jgi:HD-like signal output (HDOD) protein
MTAASSHASFSGLMDAELGNESLELPGFPEVALRVRKALGNPDIAVDEVVRMVGAEPSLTVRLLQLANSAAVNPGGPRVTVLRVAIARIGFNLARGATIAFAMSQMRRAEAWRGLEPRFRQLWEQSATLAAASHAVARHAHGVNADLALLAGMLHAVGKLFVLTRLSRFPVLLNTPALYRQVEGQWHVRVARAILTRWEISAEVVATVDHELAAQRGPGTADLGDVLFAARHIANVPGGNNLPDPGVFSASPFQRLGLSPACCGEVLASSAADIASLRAALVD